MLQTQTYYYNYDGHNNVVGLTDSSGNVVVTFKYDPWGRILEKTGNLNNPFTYSGYYYDEESELYYLINRYYDPLDGRFLSQDSYEQNQGNPYIYSDNAPVNLVDPDGNVPVLPIIVFVVDRVTAKVVIKQVVKKSAINAARRAAVKQAWKLERELVKRTGKGTRAWTKAEKNELIKTGKVKGYERHHINSVKSHPNLAGDPRNISFMRRSEHLKAHGGNWRILLGSLIDR